MVGNPVKDQCVLGVVVNRVHGACVAVSWLTHRADGGNDGPLSCKGYGDARRGDEAHHFLVGTTVIQGLMMNVADKNTLGVELGFGCVNALAGPRLRVNVVPMLWMPGTGVHEQAAFMFNHQGKLP